LNWLPPLLLQLGLADPSLDAQKIKASQAAVTAKWEQLQGLRQHRERLAATRDAAAVNLRKAEAVLRDAHYERLQQRQKLLEQQAMQASAAEQSRKFVEIFVGLQRTPHPQTALLIAL
jgi:hypothetical protein